MTGYGTAECASQPPLEVHRDAPKLKAARHLTQEGYHKMTSFTDSTKTYNVTPTSCDCPDSTFRHHQCKHQKMLIAETNKAQLFLSLKAKFDSRENGDLDTRRCYLELALSA